jgi:biopolymer transport protein ExbD
MASSRIKRQRRRKRIDTDGDPEFQVAPMVDVLLVLMLFFMAITSTEVLKKDKHLILADAKNAKKDDRKKGEITINVEWNSDKKTALYLLDDVPYTNPDDMTAVLGGRLKADPASFILIRSDKEVEYSNIANLMTSCARAGLTSITFAVISGGANKAPVPATAASP